MTKKEMIAKYKPVLDVDANGVDFKWFRDLDSLPVDKENYTLIDGVRHHIWTLHHSDDGSCDYLRLGFSRMNSLHTYVLTALAPETDYEEVSKGVYRILKSA